MTDELIERVARALAQADGVQICDGATYALSSYRAGALAAIAAMQADADLERIKRERDQAAEALREAERAIAEYYRYWTGGETRGSYDGKPERNGLWKAKHKARQTLASIEGAGHE